MGLGPISGLKDGSYVLYFKWPKLVWEWTEHVCPFMGEGERACRLTALAKANELEVLLHASQHASYFWVQARSWTTPDWLPGPCSRSLHLFPPNPLPPGWGWQLARSRRQGWPSLCKTIFCLSPHSCPPLHCWFAVHSWLEARGEAGDISGLALWQHVSGVR